MTHTVRSHPTSRLLAAALPVHTADAQRFYDRDEHLTDRAETDGHTTRFHDSRGLPVGRVRQRPQPCRWVV